MKNYKITVNGTSYDVAVEEVGGSAVTQAAPVAAPTVAPAPVAAAAAAPAAAAPAPVKEVPKASGTEGSVKISAPMPGKIIAMKTDVGQTVKKGDAVLILEAMKMENEVVAPSDGTVASINVTVGQMIEAGTTLATLS